MLRGLIGGVLLTVFGAAIAGYVIIRTGTIPANADERPPKFEAWAARTSLHAVLRRSALRGANPLRASDQNEIAGIKL